jgi:hypothetical protein
MDATNIPTDRLTRRADEAKARGKQRVVTAGVFISDIELCARWHCKPMKLWRMRQAGKLDPATRPGGGGQNLNVLAHIEDIEARSVSKASA